MTRRRTARIATTADVDRIVRLLDEVPPEVPNGPLIEYLGGIRTPETREVVLRYLDTEWTFFALKALIAMRAVGFRDRIERYLDDPNDTVRDTARKALEQLPS